MKTLILAILSVVCLATARSKASEQTVDRLLRSIRAELPKGWTASYEQQYAWLSVSRDEPVMSLSALPNSPDLFDAKPARTEYMFAFRVVTAIDPTDYRRLSDENAPIQKKVAALHEKLIRQNILYRLDTFFPRTNDEKAAVAEYRALQESLHRLPIFYFYDISVDWAYNSPAHPLISLTDEAVRDECRRVREKVVKLLFKYEDL